MLPAPATAPATATATAPNAADASGEARVERIWDAPIRLFHWLLVALLGFSWWSGEQHDMERHRISGYCILALIIFRVFWGFCGSRTARFAAFLRGPRATVAYARALARGDSPVSPGHNPIGGWSVVLMLTLLGAMVTAGVFAVDIDGIESGPLADYVTFEQGRTAADIHAILFNMILVVTAIHVAAIAFYLVKRRRNLITPMITGRRPRDATAPVGPIDTPVWRFAIGIVIAATCAVMIARGFRL